jgi:hypothetical protein
MDGHDLETVGVRGSMEDSVVRLATIALAQGCQGVVTSAREAFTLRAQLGDRFAIVTPGVRPAGTSVGDQARVVTPAEAIASGASHIVVGRPITEAADPAAVASAFLGDPRIVNPGPQILQAGQWMVLSGYCGSIIGSMKEKTSITLSREVLAGIDRMAGSKQSRSAFIEGVLHRYLIEQAKAARDVREIELINKHADELNAEAEDVLRYQAPPRER